MLLYAIGHDRPEVSLWLLENGADPNVTEVSGWSSMHAACDPSAIELLVAHGAHIRPRIKSRTGEPTGDTPLMMHAKNANIDMVRALLRHGAAPDIPDALEEIRRFRRLMSPHYCPSAKECWDLLTDVWKRYVREAIVQLLSLRYLCLAGRAAPPAKLVRCFGSESPLPAEVFTHILDFWNIRAQT